MPNDKPQDTTLDVRIERIHAILKPLPDQIAELYTLLRTTREEYIGRFVQIESDIKHAKEQMQKCEDRKCDMRFNDFERRIKAMEECCETVKREMRKPPPILPTPPIPPELPTLPPRDSGIDLAVLKHDEARRAKWVDRIINLVFVVLAAIIVAWITTHVKASVTGEPEPPVRERTHAPNPPDRR